MSVPSEIYASYSVLVTYLSKLILISGKNRTIWEFDYRCNIFKESCIEPVPGPKDSFVATSEGKYLIVVPEMGVHCWGLHDHTVYVHIFDGTSWSAQQYEFISSGSNTKWATIVGNHTTIVVKFDDEGNVISLYKAPLLLGECKDSVTIVKWERLSISVTEIEDYWRYPGQRSLLLFNNQLFLTDSRGMISTTFIEPLIGVIWIFVDSNVCFRQAPHIVRLPDGELLMMGIVIRDDHSESKSQLDVIKVHHKGIYGGPQGSNSSHLSDSL